MAAGHGGRTSRANAGPFVFFDIGQTIIDLRDTIPVLSRLLRQSFPMLGPRADSIAQSWFVGVARSVPRDESKTFRTQAEVGSETLRDLLAKERIPIDERSAAGILRRAWDDWQEQARLCEGVTIEWLAEIRRLAVGVGAVTDGDERDVVSLLDKTGLRAQFDSVTTSEAVKAYKPHERIYRVALRSLGAQPHASIFVSDSELDLVGAAGLGMSVALLRRGSASGSSRLPSSAIRLSHPSDLNRVLREYRKAGRFMP